MRGVSAKLSRSKRARVPWLIALCLTLGFFIENAVLVAIFPRGESVAVWRKGLGGTVPPPIVADMMPAGGAIQVLEADSLAITEYKLQLATADELSVADPNGSQLQVTAVGWPARFLRLAWDNGVHEKQVGDSGPRLASGGGATILWRELMFDLVVWGVTGIALLTLARVSIGRRTRIALRAAGAGMWITLLLAWLAPLLTLIEIHRVTFSPATLAAKHGVSPTAPTVSWTTFVGNHRRGVMLVQVDWMYCSEGATDLVSDVVSSGAITTLGFPLGALQARDCVWGAARLRNPELSPWRHACWILRTPPAGVGFVADWMVWGLVCFAAMTAPSAIRRVCRARRAQCLACAYPRTPSAERCSECGAGFKLSWLDVVFPGDEDLSQRAG